MNTKKTIVFVCRGNIARSPFAEEVVKQELTKRKIENKYEVVSRGIQGTVVDPDPVKFKNITFYKQLYKEAKPTLERFDVDLSSHDSTPITKDVANRANVLFAMDNKVWTGLLRLFPEYKRKILLFSDLVGKQIEITDPEGVSGAKTQDEIFTQIRNIIINGFSTLLSFTEKD